MSQYDTEEMIEALINNDMDNIESDAGYGYAMDILRYGFKGYQNYTADELTAECLERGLPNYI
jgi:hypothetical protein